MNTPSKAIQTLLVLMILSIVLTGCGKVEISDQFEYQGDLKGNLAHGYGAIYEDNQLVYEGTFENGIISGQGKYYENGVLRYEGEIDKAAILGVGTIYHQGKKLFSGEIVENKKGIMKVSGILYNQSEEAFYKGDFTIKGASVILPSYGILLYPGGEIYYEGKLDDGLPTGEGTFYTIDGKKLD